MINETIDLLGLKAKDKVTGFAGTIASVSFDLYGCVCAVLTPPCKPDGELVDGKWFDVQRLDVDQSSRVLAVPHFQAVATKPAEFKHGPAEKPARSF